MKKLYLLLMLLSSFSFLHAQLNIEFLGQINYSDQLSNLTGWDDGAGNEYAIVGTTGGTSIVDITDPTSPEEVQFVPAELSSGSIWREVRTWSNYAYVVSEGNDGGDGDGLLCIDLSGLPSSVDYVYTDCNIGLETGHTVFCDENGIIHVFGSNLAGGGDLMLDATSSPLDPVSVGEVNTWYIHDGYVRGDTLWAGNIYEGQFSVWDIEDKESPILLATQITPDNFTHNTWLTDDGNYLYTTDEVSNASVASYDVSDLTDIKELDQFRANPGTNSIPHNTFVFGNFVVTAYYRDGVVITDATYPDILIKTGEYDTSPLSGSGFEGAWGCWPFLPSGNIIVSDREEGLFILGPTYVQACYVSGNVTDADTGDDLFGVNADIVADPSAVTSTNIIGYYATGTANAGLYDITFSQTGYTTLTIEDVSLTSGVMVDLDVELEPLPSSPFTGFVYDAATGLGIASAPVLVTDGVLEYEINTDATGTFFIPAVFEGNYDIYAGKWGYITTSSFDFFISAASTVDLYVSEGYYDDFILDFNWNESEIDASTGNWVREEPAGTTFGSSTSNPGDDVTDDLGYKCYVTGNDGGLAGDDDVDDGSVILESQVFDLSDYDEPTISFYYWFFNDGGSGTPNDTLTISISNGTETEDLIKVDNSLVEEGEWLYFSGTISDYLDPSSNMQLTVRIADTPDGHICEGAFDRFEILDTEVTVAPVAAFAADNITGCEPFIIHFTDESDNSPSSWSWTFEGGTPSSSGLENPVIEYTTPGTYDVTLTATNAIGSNTILLNDYITIYDAPALTTTAGTGTATVTISGGTAPFDIVWSDAAAQTTETATGLAIGIYTVTVTDANGCVATAEANVQTVSVNNLLAGFNYAIYPNPVNDVLIVNVANNIYSTMQLIIEDITGKIIVEKNITTGENKISVSQFSAGIYSIKIFADDKLASVNKIVKQ